MDLPLNVTNVPPILTNKRNGYETSICDVLRMRRKLLSTLTWSTRFKRNLVEKESKMSKIATTEALSALATDVMCIGLYGVDSNIISTPYEEGLL